MVYIEESTPKYTQNIFIMDEEIKKQMSSTNKKGTGWLNQTKYSMCGNYSTSNMIPLTNVQARLYAYRS